MALASRSPEEARTADAHGRRARAALLKELFTTDGNGIGVSYLRVSIGSSDMNERVFSYDDLPPGDRCRPGEIDLVPDRADVIPVLKEILAIEPGIKILDDRGPLGPDEDE